VTVSITGQNDPVTAVDDADVVGRFSTRVLDVTGNDLDADVDGAGLDDVLTVLEVGGTALGVGDTVDVTTGALNSTTSGQAFVTLNGDGTLTYDPNGEFDGLAPGTSATDTFTYQVTDGNGSTDTATVTMTVTTNPPPVAVADSGTGFEGTEDASFTTGDVLANDFDQSSPPEPISVVPGAVGGAPLGTVTNNGDGTFLYDPNGQFESLAVGETATDTFTYQVTDGTTSVTGTVTVTIAGANDPVVASADGVNVGEDAGAVDVTGALLANDTDADTSDTLSVVGVGAAATGQTNLAGGVLTYDPNGQFESLAVGETATDTFTYQVSDGNGSTDTATVTVTIDGANDPVVASADGVNVGEDAGATDVTATLLANDTDADASDTLSVVGVGAAATGQTNLAGGVLTYDPNGQFESLAVGETATDTFTYQVSDGNGSTDTATVTVTIDGANDPVVANADSLAVNEDGPAGTTADVTANDTDPDASDVLAVLPGFGGGPAGVVTNNGDGTFGYDPNGQFEFLTQGETTTDTFTYQVTDGQGSTATGTVTVTVTGDNDPVTAGDDTFTANNSLTTDLGVLVNDVDPDTGDTLSVVTVAGTALAVNDTVDVTNGNLNSTTPGQAFVTLNADGTLTYDPNGEFAGPDADTFTYQVSDGTVTDTATVTLDIVTNQLPVAQPDAFATDEDSAVGGDLLADNGNGADADPDGDDGQLSVTAVNTAGTLGLVTAPSGNPGDGDFTYDPNGQFESLGTGQTAQDTFTYTLTDELGGTSTATVTVTINGANDAPTIDTNVSITVDEGAAGATIGAAALSGSDVDGGDTATNLTYTVTALPGAGTLRLSGAALSANDTFTQDDVDNDRVTYDHDGSEGATDSFTFSFQDDEGAGPTGETFTIDVNPVNDAPSIAGDGDSASFFQATGTPVVLDVNGDADIIDPDLDFLDSYDGATLTLARSGGADGDDEFGGSGNLGTLNEGGDLVLGGTNIGTVTTNSAGTLLLTFGAAATANAVDEVLQSITYANSTDTGTFTIDVTFSDGDTGAQGGQPTADATGSFDVSVSTNPPVTTVELAQLDGAATGATAGFKLNGIDGNSTPGFRDLAGSSVSMVGDIDGDGFGDFLVSAIRGEPASGTGDDFGEVYILFGADKATWQARNNGTDGFDLRNADGSVVDPVNGTSVAGFTVLGEQGEQGKALLGANSAGNGDFTGDNIPDVLLGEGIEKRPQSAFVLNGVIDPGELEGLDGLDAGTLDGAGDANGDGADDGAEFTGMDGSTGGSAERRVDVGNAGDVDGDGIDDILVGNAGLDTNGTNSGEAFLIFGSDSLDALADLGQPNGGNVLAFQGAAAGEFLGASVSGVGDIDGDGLADFAIGADDKGSDGNDGKVYVVLGSASLAGGTIDSVTSGAAGFELTGFFGSDVGADLSSVGDFNGDGIDDFVISGLGLSSAFVIFGKAGGFSDINLQDLLSSQDDGFQVFGVRSAAEAAGDVNGDGLDDIVFGRSDQDASFILFGQEDIAPFLVNNATLGGDVIDIAISDTDGLGAEFLSGGSLFGAGLRLLGQSSSTTGASVSGAGDVDGDGFDDVIIGAPDASNLTSSGSPAGQAYVIYGQSFGFNGPLDITASASGSGESLLGSRGADDLSSNGFANSVLRGGAGDDVLRVNGGERSVDGGGGFDILTPDADGQNLDFAGLDDKLGYRDVESIQLNGFGSNSLSLEVRDVLEMSGDGRELLVTGTAGGTDEVSATGDYWVQQPGTESRTLPVDAAGGEQTLDFRVYTNNNLTLLVQDDLTQNVA